MVAGKPTSLADLGYAHVGVDDGWQQCQKGKDCSFHADDGTPLVNATKFPDLGALVKYGDSKGVLLGWYQINCICCDEFTDTDNSTWKAAVYAADAKQLVDAGFHGVKLDDCGDGSGAGLVERVKVGTTRPARFCATQQPNATANYNCQLQLPTATANCQLQLPTANSWGAARRATRH
jgi:hypothetical protein